MWAILAVVKYEIRSREADLIVIKRYFFGDSCFQVLPRHTHSSARAHALTGKILEVGRPQNRDPGVLTLFVDHDPDP